MTFTMALWVLEQEKRALQWIWKAGGMSRPGGSFQDTPMSDAEVAIFSGVGLAAMFQTGAIGSLGYGTIAHAAGRSDDYLRIVKLNEPVGFSISKGKVTARFAKRSSAKLFAAKAGSRFIPYLGWALLAYDLWHVGKWIGERTS